MNPDDRPTESVTELLRAWRGGDEAALQELVPLVYEELRRLARAQMGRERIGHTLQPTGLVHEAYARLLGAEVDWRDRNHFLSVAARVMRRVLVDHARRRRSEKRGGDPVRVTLSDFESRRESRGVDVLDLHDTLERLEEHDERQARVVELHYFGGLTYPEICDVVEISQATVERDMRHARAWISRELSK